MTKWDGGTGAVGEGIEVRFLSECPGFLGTVTRWVSEEWEETTEEELGTRVLGNVGCPPTLVAVFGEEVVGVIAFTLYSADGRELGDLWVNILYVEETMRGAGIGRKLVAAGLELARTSGVERLFVRSEVGGYYEAMGWVRDPRYDGGLGNEVLRFDF